jgi:hypothetical protein
VTDTVQPDPLIVDGVVRVDLRERRLVVRPDPYADGQAKRLWRAAVRAEAASGRGGRDAPTVWASGAGQSQISFGRATDDDALMFGFYPGHPAYKELVSTPGLRARIAVDRANGGILGVRFRGR